MTLLMNEEEWRDVVGFEGLYVVSNKGRVKRKAISRGTHANPLKQQVNTRGYLSCNLYRNQKGTTKVTHRLVAEAFVPNPHGKPFVNHIDGNKLNNSTENLEWVTAQENVRHAIDTGLLVPSPSQKSLDMAHKSTMKPVIRSDGREYESVASAARDVGVRSPSIQRALKTGSKSAGWYWRYEQ